MSSYSAVILSIFSVLQLHAHTGGGRFSPSCSLSTRSPTAKLAVLPSLWKTLSRFVSNSVNLRVRLVNSNSPYFQVVEDLLHDEDRSSREDDSSTPRQTSSARDSGSDSPRPPGAGAMRTPVDAITPTPSKVKEESEKKEKETKDGVKKEIKEEEKSPPKDEVKEEVKNVKKESKDGGKVVKQDDAAVRTSRASFWDLESGQGQQDQSHDNEKTPTASKNASRATPKLSRRNRTPRLGQTYDVSPMPDDPNAMSLPVIPPQVGLVHDLDTRVAAPALLCLHPDSDPGLNSLLQHQTELMKAHNANINGLSVIGDYAGK